MKDKIIELHHLHNELTAFLSTCNIDVKRRFTLRTNHLKSLKVACIMDEFTFLSYAPECKLLEVTPDNWKNEIESFSPDMLFIESAWNGKDKLWQRKIAHGSEELFALISFCKENAVPVVYWGKEDPLYTQTFMPVATQADFIFTTDIDAVQKYKLETINPHVYHLHFAAQPVYHNPIEKYERKDAFCFAGSYYHRRAERSLLFDHLSDYFIKTRGLDIYDRNYGEYGFSTPEYAFPEKYGPHILGYLHPEEIDKAYKGYHFGVSMNSITQSQSMFARRNFELMASNTIVVGNFSRGVKNYFGELSFCTDDVATLESALSKYCGNPITLQKHRLKALRKVLSEHLYEDRLSYIIEKVFGINIKPALPSIAVLSNETTEDGITYIKATFERQTFENKTLHFSIAELYESGADYIAFFSSVDYYGSNYLLDLALATRYLDKDVDGICKGTEHSYTFTNTLMLRSGIIKAKVLSSLLILEEDECFSGNFFAIDPFNYRNNYKGSTCTDVDDLPDLYEGFSSGDIQPNEDLPFDTNRFILSKSNTLILSNVYPSYDEIYQNMFVHARVKAYQQKGHLFDVMHSNYNTEDGYREFDGVDVIDGSSQMISDIVQSGKIKTVCIHFLSERMFSVLEPHLENIRLIIWVHGVEIQPWWRRDYNYLDYNEIEEAKKQSEKRMAFWHHVFHSAKAHDIHFVFVSQYFANEVMEDYQIELPKERYSIIHNVIDTEVFNYVEKDISQRKKIFSCRPFTFQNYANDLSVKAILSLSKHKEFTDMHFHIAGSGPLFNKTVKPLRKFSNVTLEERFYKHDEIAKLHKEHGICLIPTRMDSQGVSRDEAMASGLVPVTNAVAAIPEFVDEQCGILVLAEDWQGLADGILKLYHNPELFKQLSANAASRVRTQHAKELVIEKELDLILQRVT